jgi:CheY-like chemotaxis protein
VHHARSVDVTRRCLHLLVVDDERAFTNLVSEFLELAGHWVTRAYDGAEALQQLRTGTLPDVVLTDVMMPKLNGLDLLDEVRRMSPVRPVPFLLLSAGRDPRIRSDLVSFMSKPVDFDRLLGEIERLADGHSRRARRSLELPSRPQ